ncbi:MAG: hypothetical protein RJQ09_08470 [Cyclobacteriaceae bacterium]
MNTFSNKGLGNWILPALIAVVFALSACGEDDIYPEGRNTSKSETKTSNLGDTLSVGVNGSAVLSGFEFTLDAITEDSRCPTKAFILCVWAGQVAFDFTVTVDGVSETFNHAVSIDKPETFEFSTKGYTIHFVEITPEKEDVDPIDESEYRISLYILK